MMVSATTALIICLLVMIVLLIIGVPIFMSLLLAGLVGTYVLEGGEVLSNIAGKIAFNQVTGYSLLAIPMFVLMGNLLMSHKMGDDLYEGVNKWFGFLPGGLAIAGTVVCAIFGFMSGSNTAAAATIGGVAIPAMEKKGYDRALSLGTMAVAGTLAALIPPSTIMIIYGTSVNDVSIGKVFIGGIIPGLILAALMSIYIYIYASIKPEKAPRGETSTFKEKLLVLPKLIPVIIIFIAVVGGMFFGIWTAIEASAASVFTTLAVVIVNGRFRVKAVIEALLNTVNITGMIYMIIIGATIMGHLFFIAGFREIVENIFLKSNLSAWGTMILILFILTILGTFLDVVALIMISVPIFLPIAVKIGYDGVWFGVIMTIASEMALCTPPVGVNLFVIQGIAPPGTSLLTVAKGAFPFIGVIWILLLLLIMYPGIVTWLPNLMIK
jgi:tripartite ATP-independent transporter DctM subunit